MNYMKNIAFILTLVAGTLSIGCSKASLSTHLTKAQVLTIAKPVLPLHPGESYYESFTNGTWKVWASDDGSIKGGWGATTVLTIQDADGKILSQTTNL
jgi:major membrane immunogen (membrane-anchored lipoprotein)